MTIKKYRNPDTIPFELLGYQRKLQSQRKIGMIIYEMFLNRESNKLQSVSISQLERDYKIRSETVWKYLGERISRKSLENAEKCIKLIPEDIRAIQDVLDLSNKISMLSPFQAKITKYVINYLLHTKE
jgi:hypothetical protein